MRITLCSDGQMTTPSPISGGLQRVVHDLGRLFVEQGHEVTLVAAEGSHLAGATVIEATPALFGQVMRTEEAISKAALSTTWDTLVDVSHTHMTAYDKPEHSIIYHEDITPLAKHPRIVFISDSQRYYTYKGKHGTKIMHNKLYPPEFPSLFLPNGPEGATQYDVALYLGNIVPHKGAHLVVQVAKRMGIKLWIAGKGYDPLYVANLQKTFNDDDILYIGAVNEAEKYRVISQARMMILCPNKAQYNYHEVGQLVAVEAQMMGTPILTSRNGGIKEYILPDAGLCGYNLKEMIRMGKEVWEWKQERSAAIRASALMNFDLRMAAGWWNERLEEAKNNVSWAS